MWVSLSSALQLTLKWCNSPATETQREKYAEYPATICISSIFNNFPKSHVGRFSLVLGLLVNQRQTLTPAWCITKIAPREVIMMLLSAKFEAFSIAASRDQNSGLYYNMITWHLFTGEWETEKKKEMEIRREEDMKCNKGCKLDFNLLHFKFNFAVHACNVFLFCF